MHFLRRPIPKKINSRTLLIRLRVRKAAVANLPKKKDKLSTKQPVLGLIQQNKGQFAERSSAKNSAITDSIEVPYFCNLTMPKPEICASSPKVRGLC